MKVKANRFTFAVDGCSRIIRMEDIYYFEIFSHVAVIHTVDSEYSFRGSLKEIASQLPPGSFGSPHQSYGYLKPDVKAIINRIVEELSSDERIATLYDLWYEQREEVLKIYTQEVPKRVTLVDNPEFKTIKNAVIQEAMNILADQTPVEETMEETTPELPPEPTSTEVDKVVFDPLAMKEKRTSMWKLYRQAKELLDYDSESYEPKRAADLLIDAAEQGCDIAKCRLPHWAIAVYVYLADRANKDGQCWPAIPTIARELRLSQSTVRRALNDLRKEGLLEIQQ